MSVEERHQREKTARRESILAAASRVFARYGLDGATIETIAYEAEVAVGTVYLYFRSRDDLYLNLMVERAAHLKARYLEIQVRGLDPLGELHAICAAFLEYLRDSRALRLTWVSYAQEQGRLRHPTELRQFKRAMEVSREVWGLWKRTVRRCIDAGLISNSMGTARTAAVIWAAHVGAFNLSGEGFHDITGLSPAHFVEDALKFHLSTRDRNGAQRRSNRADPKKEA